MANGQALGDTLAGAFGHGVDRPALNAYVATSQAQNGLRSAQTDLALNNAQLQQEELQAHSELENSLMGVKGDDGNPLLQPSAAHLVATELKGKYGDAKTVMEAFRQAQQAHNTGIISDVNNYPDPNAPGAKLTAAIAGNNNKLPEVQQAPNNYIPTPGMGDPVVHQTPYGVAETQDAQAKAHLAQRQANDPELFHPKGGNQTLGPQLAGEMAEYLRQNPQLAGNFRSLLANGGPEVIHAFLHPGVPYVPEPGAGGALSGAAPSSALPASAQPSATAPPNGVLPAPGVSLHEQALIRNDFASGLGAKQSTALNTMAHHSQLFDMIADQLDNGNFKPTNAISQMWQRVMGSPIPSNLQMAGGFLAREAVKATVNSGAGTGAERELAVGPSDGPMVLHGAAQTLRTLAGGQLQSLSRRAARGGVDINQLLDPDVQQMFGRGKAAATEHQVAGVGGEGAPAMSLDEYLKSHGH